MGNSTWPMEIGNSTWWMEIGNSTWPKEMANSTWLIEIGNSIWWMEIGNSTWLLYWGLPGKHNQLGIQRYLSGIYCGGWLLSYYKLRCFMTFCQQAEGPGKPSVSKVLGSKAPKYNECICPALLWCMSTQWQEIIFTQSMIQMLISSRNALGDTRKCFLHDPGVP